MTALAVMCKARYSLFISWGEMQDIWLTIFSMKTLSTLQVQDLITFCLLWTEKFQLWNGQVFPILESLTISVTFFCTKVLHMRFHLSIQEQGALGGWKWAYQPARRTRAFSSDVMTYTSILAGASLLTLWPVLARGTKILTAEGLTCDKGHHDLPNHTTLRFTDTAAPTALK